MESTHRWLVPEAVHGQRLDVHVAEHLAEPRNQVQQWIRSGALQIDGDSGKPSTTLLGGEEIAVTPPQRTDTRVTAESGELDIVYQDNVLIVINKPSGLAVHPGAGRTTGTLVHRLLHHFPEIEGVGGEGRPGIVHRLDLGTTGVMLVARTQSAYQVLSSAFQERKVRKIYLGVCEGRPKSEAGTMEWSIGRHPHKRKQMWATDRGKSARTDYKVLGIARRSALLELDIHTGRTHQIRVHLKTLGHPLLGDALYGRELPRNWGQDLQAAIRVFDRPALHAWKLQLAHPVSGEEILFMAPIPEDFQRLWQGLGGPTLSAVPDLSVSAPHTS